MKLQCRMKVDETYVAIRGRSVHPASSANEWAGLNPGECDRGVTKSAPNKQRTGPNSDSSASVSSPVPGQLCGT